ncbi:MAG: GNAT family N-acetyltransferase [Cytophagaceae bacterium]|nr:GNAT family N-acetyltransferase [Cytophagaceae bacterium]
MAPNIHFVFTDLSNVIHQRDMLSLLSQYATDIMGGGEDLSPEVKNRLVSELKNRSSVILLAYENDLAVGLAICFEGFSTFYARPLLNIHDFVVSQSHRGRGIARLMLDRLELLARERNCCKLTLEVLEGNSRAQKVYKDFGFASYVLDEKMGRALFWDKKLI